MQIVLHTQKLANATIDRLHEAGFIAIRVRDTSDVRVINSEPPAISGDALLTAALKAMKAGNGDGWNERKLVMDTFLSALLISAAEKQVERGKEGTQ